jgi:hypothetical protein
MIVQQIIGIIEKLKKIRGHSAEDMDLLNSIAERFNRHNENQRLTGEEFTFVLDLFRQHWTNIQSKKMEYIFIDSPIYGFWEKLAKLKSAETEIPYLKILFPNVIVQHVIGFIEELKSIHGHSAKDIEILNAIAERFNQRNEKQQLTGEDLNFLLHFFRQRWTNIQGKKMDYTLIDSPINNTWAKFAKLVSAESKIPYLKILFPTILNDRDPRDNSDLTDTARLTSFYIGDDGRTLLRKFSFCVFMAHYGYFLSTAEQFNTPEKQKLKLVSIKELDRLNRCVQVDGSFLIQDIKYDNFWHFLKCLVFPKLVNCGAMPIDSLARLIALIDEYYRLKETEGKFSDFLESARLFYLKHMDSLKLGDANHLYGQKIFLLPGTSGKNIAEECYLFEVFIRIERAKTFNLDSEMLGLSMFLFNYIPKLKEQEVELEPLYKSLMKGATDKDVTDLEKKKKIIEYGYYRDCHALLVSLFVTNFECRGERITMWDLENIIPKQFYTLYLTLKNMHSLGQDFGILFFEIKAEIERKAKDYIRNFTRTWLDSTRTWLKRKNDFILPTVGAFWFEPEVIMSALLSFPTLRSNRFIDNILHTYYNDEEEHDKQLRVNIQFSKFLSTTLNESQRNRLILIAKRIDIPTAKEQFLNNCRLALNLRLYENGYFRIIKPAFFSEDNSLRSLEELNNNFIINEHVDSLNKLIEYYKSNLPMNLRAEITKDGIRKYLNGISWGILSIERVEQATPYRSNPDPIAAPT